MPGSESGAADQSQLRHLARPNRMPAQQRSKLPPRQPRSLPNLTPLSPQPFPVSNQLPMGPQYQPSQRRPPIPGSRSTPPQQVNEMPPIAHQRNHRRRQQMPHRKILDQQKQPVSLDVIGLQRSGLSGRMGISVIHHGVGRIQAFPARPSAAEPQIGVFTVQEKVLIESPDLIQHGPPIQRRRPARQQDLLLAKILFRPPQMPPLLAA